MREWREAAQHAGASRRSRPLDVSQELENEATISTVQNKLPTAWLLARVHKQEKKQFREVKRSCESESEGKLENFSALYGYFCSCVCVSVCVMLTYKSNAGGFHPVTLNVASFLTCSDRASLRLMLCYAQIIDQIELKIESARQERRALQKDFSYSFCAETHKSASQHTKT